jgi:hypothetical protein
MKFSSILVTLAAAVSAAPTLNERDDAITVSATTAQWTIESFKRTCNSADTSCDIGFTILPSSNIRTACAYTITGSPASRATLNGFNCAQYTLTSKWDGQFGPGNGFTVWSLVDRNARQIAWPSYADWELVNGVPVTPNKSFAVQNL